MDTLFLSIIVLEKIAWIEIMLPPWKKFPSYKPSSSLWKNGEGQSYMKAWREYFEELQAKDQVNYKKSNPPPFYWFFFYWQKAVPEVWTFPFLLLLVVTWPFRCINHIFHK
jgi:hypothetical protein